MSVASCVMMVVSEGVAANVVAEAIMLAKHTKRRTTNEVNRSIMLNM